MRGHQGYFHAWRGVLCGLIALAVVLVAWVPFAPGASARVLPILVMGDSYSAGNGAGDYFGARGCWRSPNNYAGVFARALEGAPYHQPTVLDNVACSGDTTHAFAHWTDGRRPQLDAVNKGYRVILLTVGGDDIDFAGIVQNCLIQFFRDGRKCNTLLSAAEHELRDGALESRIVDVLDGIRQRANPRARIVLLGYPYIEGQERYMLPYGHGKSIDVPKRIRALGDLGDRVQQQAVDRLNAKYRGRPFVFVKTKALFAGHELDALSLNPNRWFVAPETDAGLAWRAWWYHPNPTGWYEEAQLLLRDPNVPKPRAGGPVDITYLGRIGALTIDVSTGADIMRILGRPGYTTTGSFANAPGVTYELFGYGCRDNTCVTEYYVNLGTGRLESFETTSRRFALPGGIRVGMSAAAASRRERRPIELGCAGITLRTPKLAILLWTRGGRRLSNGQVTGGRVAGIAIDDRKYGTGVAFC
jgi:lysophospholipase L1-like esterase